MDGAGPWPIGRGSAASVRWWLAARKAVADELQSWVEETDVDGFNLAYAVTHETFRDVVELLVPELQKRGVFKQRVPRGDPARKTVRRRPASGRASPGASYRRDARTAASVEEKVT
ncbi:hypothetical protein LNP74_06085 [Klebsiella pneumoniae subsp. pneumoniae]|nr:hypothetical protein [Klebsiella pneumoniae subsp. pneumoniae]